MSRREKDESHPAGGPAHTPGLAFHSLDYASSVGIMAYAASATITPICLLIIARELSFSLLGGGAIEVVRSGLILVTLVGSGFVAARWGKPVSLGMSCLVMGSGLMLYSIAPTYGTVLLGVGLLGLGGGIVEGLLNPLIQDLHPGDSGRYLNIVNGFWSIGVLLTMLVGGELLTREVSWRLIVGSLGFLSVFSGILFLLLRREVHASPRFAAAEVFGHKWFMVRLPRFWLFMGMMFAAGAAEGALTFWSASFIQLDHGGLPRTGGIGVACFAVGMILGRFASGLWVGQHRLRRLIFFSAGVGTIASMLIPLAQTLPALFAVLFVSGLAVACFWPSLQSYAADRLPVETTSLFILLSCAGIPGFAFAAWLIGLVGEYGSLKAAFFIIPAFFVALAVLLLIERFWKVKE
ncbi:MAG: MFS transporter [Opitutales bacterium]